MTFRTGENGGCTFACLGIGGLLIDIWFFQGLRGRVLRFLISTIGFARDRVLLRHGYFAFMSVSEFDESGSDIAGDQYSMRGDVFYSPLRHVFPDRIVWVLHDRDATPLLDRIESCRTVVHETAEYDPHDAWTIRPSSRTEQRVDGGPMAIFSWPALHSNFSVFNREVMVRACNVDSSRLDIFLVERIAGLQSI